MICEGGGGGAAAGKEWTMRLAKALSVLHACEKSRVLSPSAKSNCRLVKFIDDIDLNGPVFAPIVGQKNAEHDRQD